MRLDKQSLQFSLHETGRTTDLLEAYERLIYDAMCGDHTLFTSAEGIERLWEAIEAVAREPAAGAAVRAGIVGTERDPPADRARRVAPPVRTDLAENCVTSRGPRLRQPLAAAFDDSGEGAGVSNALPPRRPPSCGHSPLNTPQ